MTPKMYRPIKKRQTKARRVEIARKAGLASAAKKCEAESFAIAPLPALVAALKWLEKHREDLQRPCEREN